MMAPKTFIPPVDPLLRKGDLSVVEVTRVGDRSRLTACCAISPLKVLNPRVQGDCCAVVLSSYGGGFVEGDCVDLRVTCGSGATLYLGTQAFTKVYKNPSGIASVQQMKGVIENNGCAVILPDPVVPFAQSIFHQRQYWRLEKDACLLLVDSHTAGRGAFGEQFAYASYASDIVVTTAGRPVLIERYLSEPLKQSLQKVGAFGDFTVVLNVFVVGFPHEQRYDHLVNAFQTSLSPFVIRSPINVSVPLHEMIISYAQAKPQVFVIRALGKSVESLRPIYGAIRHAVKHPMILGVDPLLRKY